MTIFANLFGSLTNESDRLTHFREEGLTRSINVCLIDFLSFNEQDVGFPGCLRLLRTYITEYIKECLD